MNKVANDKAQSKEVSKLEPLILSLKNCKGWTQHARPIIETEIVETEKRIFDVDTSPEDCQVDKKLRKKLIAILARLDQDAAKIDAFYRKKDEEVRREMQGGASILQWED